jgi:hypothetical protein
MAKLELKDILSAVDQGGRDIWDMLDDEQKKSVSFFLLNRYVSSVKTSKREVQEHFVLATNEYFNKHFYSLNKHPKLLWQLLCMCGYENKQEYFHEWIGFKKKKAEPKKLKFLEEFYPARKMEDLELLSQITSTKDLKQLAIDAGWDDKTIAKFF